MAEANEIFFSYQEVVAALVKKQNLHEGLWGLSIEFGLGALNMKKSQDGSILAPAGLLAIERIGIRQYSAASNLTVNAAEVNPAPSSKKGSKAPSRGKATK